MGLGTWAIGGPWDWGWSEQSDEDSIAAIQHAIDLGINWLDTAPCYGLGHSEEIVGQAIKGRRDRVLIATKCGLIWDDRASGRVRSWLKADSVRQEVEDSLRRLALDVIDLYQIHWPDPDEDIEDAWNEMIKMVDEGLVRHVGVSNRCFFVFLKNLKKGRLIHETVSNGRHPLYSSYLPSCNFANLSKYFPSFGLLRNALLVS